MAMKGSHFLFLKYLERVENIHQMISSNQAGKPYDFSKKLNISESMLYKCIIVMKTLGAPIIYDKHLSKYYYTEPVTFECSFKKINEKPKKNEQVRDYAGAV